MTSPDSGSAFRRVVTALVFDLRFDPELMSVTSGNVIAQALKQASSAIEEAVVNAGGRMAVGGPDSVVALFGAEDYYIDQTARAVSVAASCLAHLKDSQSRAGLQIGAAIHCAEMLLILEEEVKFLGAGQQIVMDLARVARPGELLLTQTALDWFAANPPQGFQCLKGKVAEEPNLENVPWTKVDFYTLPDDMLQHVWLFGPDVQQNYESAVFEFCYLYSILFRGTSEPMPILGLSQLGAGELNFADTTAEPSGYLYRIGKYRITKKLGVGGMGEVWLGMDDLGMSAAIKVMCQSASANVRMRERFVREARVMAKLQHRNICRVFELGEFDGIQYLAMEYISGITLAELLCIAVPEEAEGSVASLVKAIKEANEGEEKPEKLPAARLLPLDEAVRLMIEIADGIQFAHEHGVLHRDLKPANVLIREDGEPVVSDFGLAKFDFEGEDSLSLSGELFGTLEYMAPEQALSSKEVDARADVYGLGGILYQLITGHRHFRSTSNIVSDAQRLQTHEPEAPRSIRKELPQDLEVITLKALSLQPEGRYRTVAAFREDLVRYQTGDMILARPPTLRDLALKVYSKNRLPVLILASALAIIVMLSVWSFWQVNQQRLQALKALAKEEQARKEAEAAKAEAAGVRKIVETAERRAETAVAERDAAKAELLAFREDVLKFEAGDKIFSRPGSYRDLALALFLRHQVFFITLVCALVLLFLALLCALWWVNRQRVKALRARVIVETPKPVTHAPQIKTEQPRKPTHSPRIELNLGGSDKRDST